MPTPIFFVRNKKSPSLAVLFCFRFLISTIPVTANPKIGSGASMLCPPAKGIPACLQTVLLPSNTLRAMDAGNLSIGQPRIATAIIGFPPIAYTSLIALAEAILPKSNGSFTMGIKKSVVLMTAIPFPIS